jgi:cysteine desulfurase family protein (TIGR01976 family)
MTSLDPDLIASCRAQFPALSRRVGDYPAAFFDGPGGTQVPQRVIDAVSRYLAHTNANHGGLYATSLESDELISEVHQGVADFVGARDADEIVFGQNMTSLTFSISRALARTWRPRDEIVVTRLDHDANVSPWVLAARDAGATVRWVDFRPEDCTLNLDQFQHTINERTRLVAVGCASNATGGINPVRQIADWAHSLDALVYLDAVHYAPHALIDVHELGADFLACSAYKFFGPHVGMLWGRRELLEGLDAYKVRPAPDSPPDKWMTGTQNHEAMAGALAAVEYLADLGRAVNSINPPPSPLPVGEMADRRRALAAAYAAIGDYERELCGHLLAGLSRISDIRVWGIADPARLHQRVATICLTHRRATAPQLAEQLGRRGIFTWHGNYYALNLSEGLGHEPSGMLRVGLVHYNTREEVDRLLAELAAI